MFLVDDPRSEPRVLHELTQNKMAEDAERDIAIRFVNENDRREISAKAVSAKRKVKKNSPSWLVPKHGYDVDSSEAESSSEEDEKVSASEEEAVTETKSANEIQEKVESSYSDDSSADKAKRRDCAGKPKPAPSSSIVNKSSKKAPKKSNKRNKSLSEDEIGRFPSFSQVSADSLRLNIQECSRSLYAFIAFRSTCFTRHLVMRNLHETSTQRAR